mmetsp:Transcript_31009/g.48599  ORF Transcript_31009/g.48599 Transcript_31009/m.48599 type:complete len:110 (-) Transcript_31009:868-1197(-)
MLLGEILQLWRFGHSSRGSLILKELLVLGTCWCTAAEFVGLESCIHRDTRCGDGSPYSSSRLSFSISREATLGDPETGDLMIGDLAPGDRAPVGDFAPMAALGLFKPPA